MGADCNYARQQVNKGLPGRSETIGVLPVAAVLFYAVPASVGRHGEAAWGLIAGVVGFLGLSHAMATVLVNHSLLPDETTATVISLLGLVVGAGIRWILPEGPFIATEPARIVGSRSPS